MKLRTGWAVVLLILLIVFAVCFGAYRGWSGERARVEETYAGLETMMQARVEAAYNLLAVAGREQYVKTADEGFLDAVNRVKADKDVLEGSASLREKAEANENLTVDAQALLQRLAALPAVQADERDRMYAESYLPQMMEQSGEKTAGAQYNSAAAEFNKKINSTFSGMIARILGIRPAEEFLRK
ncbi:MAG: hypothetical protein J5472_07140 [Clostridia bacterium]|nr:hypothetical protein [Clostridia bacterium]